MVVNLWFSVACFGCQSFGDVSPYDFFIPFLVRFRLLSGQPFEIELPTRLTICSLCILIICNFRYFEGGIAPSPGHCILVTLQ